ncbi:MAG: ATP-binding protein [Bacilli bacterium]
MFNKLQIGNYKIEKVDLNKENFCKKNYFKNNSKCLKFYKKMILINYEGFKNCPYGYTCFFRRDYIFTSLLIEFCSEIGKIKKRYKYNNDKEYKNLKIYDISIKDKIEKFARFEEAFNIKSNGFHDLKNWNTNIRDLIETISPKDRKDENVEYIIGQYNSIYEKIKDNHNSKKENIILSTDNIDERIEKLKNRNKLYDDIFDFIEKIVLDIDFRYNKIKKTLKDKSNGINDLFEVHKIFDFRLRYQKRLLNFEIDDEKELKYLNLHRNLKKLEKLFIYSAKKKQQTIKIKSANEEYSVYAHDDIFLAFFILIENTIKYSPKGGQIEIELKKDRLANKLTIIFINESDYISQESCSRLTEKGFQAENYKEGSGLGLFLANQILLSSGCNYTNNYDEKEKKFITEIEFLKIN